MSMSMKGCEALHAVRTQAQAAFHAADEKLNRYSHALELLILARGEVSEVLRLMIDHHLEREGVVLDDGKGGTDA